MSVKITIEANGKQHEFFESDNGEYISDMEDWYMQRDESGIWASHYDQGACGLSMLLDHAREQWEQDLENEEWA